MLRSDHSGFRSGFRSGFHRGFLSDWGDEYESMTSRWDLYFYRTSRKLVANQARSCRAKSERSRSRLIWSSLTRVSALARVLAVCSVPCFS